jgi:hypothetical protein
MSGIACAFTRNTDATLRSKGQEDDLVSFKNIRKVLKEGREKGSMKAVRRE